MFRNECNLRNNCDNWPHKCEKCDGKLYWREPARNTFKKLFSYYGLDFEKEEKIIHRKMLSDKRLNTKVVWADYE